MNRFQLNGNQFFYVRQELNIEYYENYPIYLQYITGVDAFRDDDIMQPSRRKHIAH